jgi:hypothetical protein
LLGIAPRCVERRLLAIIMALRALVPRSSSADAANANLSSGPPTPKSIQHRRAWRMVMPSRPGAILSHRLSISTTGVATAAPSGAAVRHCSHRCSGAVFGADPPVIRLLFRRCSVAVPLLFRGPGQSITRC